MRKRGDAGRAQLQLVDRGKSAKLYLRIGKSRSEAAEAAVARFRCGGTSPDAHKAVPSGARGVDGCERCHS